MGIAKRGLAEATYDQLKEWLLESRYGPDEKLPVEEIAAELGVSRHPLMDAMKRLETEGFVSILPQVGCHVRRYSASAILDFFQLQAYAEGLVAELATAKADAHDLLQLRLISEQFGQLTARTTIHSAETARLYRSLNRRFHNEIQRIARSPCVTEVVEKMGERADFFISTAGRSLFNDAKRLKETHREHEEIVAAIMGRDGRSAGEAMRRHLLSTSHRLQGILKQKPQSEFNALPSALRARRGRAIAG